MSDKLPNILTEEELKNIEQMYCFGPDATFSRVIDSHKVLFSANAELSFELMLHKKYEGFLVTVIRTGGTLSDGLDFYKFKEIFPLGDWNS